MSVATAPARFVKPTVAEISNYCSERNNGIDAQKFFDYYESNGWKVGRNSMKDWKAAVRTWEKREHRATEQQPQQDNSWLNTLANL